MPHKPQFLSLSVCFVIATVVFARAEAQTFADLMTRAQAEAAAGHQSSPPGDNVLETVGSMLDLMPSATPAQLQDLYLLLEKTRSDLPSAPSAAPPQTDAVTTPAEPPAAGTEPAPAAVPPPAAAPPQSVVDATGAERPKPVMPNPVKPIPLSPRSAEPDRSGRVARLTAVDTMLKHEAISPAHGGFIPALRSKAMRPRHSTLAASTILPTSDKPPLAGLMPIRTLPVFGTSAQSPLERPRPVRSFKPCQ